MQSDKNVINEESNHNEHVETKQHFLSDEKFQLLIRCQQAIYEATEISPSLRKLVNELINPENIEKLQAKFIRNLSN